MVVTLKSGASTIELCTGASTSGPVSDVVKGVPDWATAEEAVAGRPVSVNATAEEASTIWHVEP